MEPCYNEDKVRYLLYAPEECPETGKKHWQGYVYFRDKVSIKTAQRILESPNIHMEPVVSDLECNKAYIIGPYEKDGKSKPFNPDHKLFGVEPKQGKRVDLDELKEKIMNDEETVDNIIVSNPIMYHQYGRTLEKIEDIKMSKKFRTKMTTCDWLCGPTGIGKSHYAFENFTPETHYVVPNDNGWWDNYRQQDIVILNDFRGHISYNELLQLIDKWPYNVPRRGRPPLPFTSKHIIITSSLGPEEIYNKRDAEDKIEQLMRRINVKNEKHLKIEKIKEKIIKNREN